MPSALPINNRRKPNYLITPSHCVQTELPVVDNKYLISEETERINQGCWELLPAWALPGTYPGVGVYLMDPPQRPHRVAANRPTTSAHSLPLVTSQNRIKQTLVPFFSSPLLNQQIPKEVSQLFFFFKLLHLELHVLTDEVRAVLGPQWSWFSFPQTCWEEASFFLCLCFLNSKWRHLQELTCLSTLKKFLFKEKSSCHPHKTKYRKITRDQKGERGGHFPFDTIFPRSAANVCMSSP